MRVLVAKNAGACYGVQRALDLAQDAVSVHAEVHTLGELIHNPRVVDQLATQGVQTASSIDEVDSGSVVIRSHGVAPCVFDQIKAKDLQTIDATCPHVLRAQRAAAELARLGCHVIIVGEEGHPEVEGIKAHALRAGGQVSVVRDSGELPDQLHDRVGVVVQTTQKLENLNDVVDALSKRNIRVIVRNTICSATQKRQEEAKELAQIADVMVVIGGRNSSNTTRLAEICHDECDHTYHIESAEEITFDMLAQAVVVGVTAGASTPQNQIDEVVERIGSLSGQSRGIPYEQG